jgi:hypothetical protein
MIMMKMYWYEVDTSREGNLTVLVCVCNKKGAFLKKIDVLLYLFLMKIEK